MSPCVGLLLLCVRPLVWAEGARDFARAFDFGRGLAAVCLAWPPVLEGCRGGLKYSLFMSGYIDSIVGSPAILIPASTTSPANLVAPLNAPQPNFKAPTAASPAT